MILYSMNLISQSINISAVLIVFKLYNFSVMHNYNPPNKYSMRTRIGNWSEEWDLEETK